MTTLQPANEGAEVRSGKWSNELELEQRRWMYVFVFCEAS
jgi:hypothetical protein